MHADPALIRSAKPNVSPDEWAMRTDLAAAYRAVALYGWDDLVFTHVSARVPGPEHHFLINPYGMTFDEITASSLVKIDLDGRKVSASPHDVNPAGFTIHSAIHAAREDAACVLHLHTRDGVALSAQAGGLLPISQQATVVLGSLAYHDYEGIALYMEEQARMAADLGKTAKAMILRNHGLLALGRTVREAFEVMYYLDCACQIQIDACSAGMHNVQIMSEAAARTSTQQFNRPDRPAHHKDWPALLRMLERRGVRYAD